MNLNHRTVTWLLFVVFVACWGTSTMLRAQDKEAERPIKFPVEMKPFTLKLVDEAGQPISDAKVVAYGVRCEESPGSWIVWPEDNAGKNEFKSDEGGLVQLKYPVKLGAPGLWMTINKIDFTCTHPDFVTGRVEFDPATGKAEHVLVKGCRTTFSCVDENGQAISKFGLVIAGAGTSAAWKLTDAELRSGGVPDGSWQTMLVSPREDGHHLFSGVLPARYAKDKAFTIRNAKLRPGMRLSGSLSANVPRPVANGKVIAWCLPKPEGDTYGDKNPSLGWWEEATIAEDGNFDFPSLPRGGTVQLIALCDGWLISDEEAFFTIGERIDISDEDLADNHVADVQLQMAPTGSVEVEVLGPDGKPLVGATVTTWPNQKLHLGGSTLLGGCFRSLLGIESQITGRTQSFSFRDAVNSRYEGKTDAQGKYTLTDIPIKRNESLYVSMDNMRMKPNKDNGNKDPGLLEAVEYRCESVELHKVTVHMEVIKE